MKEEELKTLKDFHCACFDCGECGSDFSFCKKGMERYAGCSRTINEDYLREEAIRWIKKIEPFNCSSNIPKKYQKFFLDVGGDCGSEECCDNLIEFIKHFFNITEEDLK